MKSCFLYLVVGEVRETVSFQSINTTNLELSINIQVLNFEQNRKPKETSGYITIAESFIFNTLKVCQHIRGVLLDI